MVLGLHGLHGVFVPSLVMVVKDEGIGHALTHHLLEWEDYVWATMMM